jgi:hypothetical protein
MVRRVLGVVAVVLGAVGLLLAVAALVGVWVFTPEAQRRALELAGTGESALKALQDDLAEARRTVGHLEERFRSAGPLVQRLGELEKERLEDPRAQRETFQQIQDLVLTARTLIHLQRGLVRAGDRSLEVVDSLRGGQAERPAAERSTRATLQSLDELERWVDKIDKVSKQLRQKGAAEQLVAQVQEVYDKMRAVLEQAGGQIRALGERVKRVEAKVERVREQLPVWLAWAKGIATALLVWSAWAQWALIAHGRRLWRSASAG